MLRKNLPLSECQLKFTGPNKASFSGYASAFGGVDSYGDTIVRGAFTDALKTGSTPKMFFNHKSWDLPIGKWLQVKEDSHGLLVDGELTPGSRQAEEVRAALDHETLDGLSIGFILGTYENTEKGRLIKSVAALREISVVSFPADASARIDPGSLKSELSSVQTLDDLTRMLCDLGGFQRAAADSLLLRARELMDIEEQPATELKSIFENFRLPEFRV